MRTVQEFENMLKAADLHYWFHREFGDDCYTENWANDGWLINKEGIQYRSEDLFDNHEDGYNWDFYSQDFWRTVLVYVIQSHGFKITHNSGDEEDGLLTFERINP